MTDETSGQCCLDSFFCFILESQGEGIPGVTDKRAQRLHAVAPMEVLLGGPGRSASALSTHGTEGLTPKPPVTSNIPSSLQNLLSTSQHFLIKIFYF